MTITEGEGSQATSWPVLRLLVIGGQKMVEHVRVSLEPHVTVVEVAAVRTVDDARRAVQNAPCDVVIVEQDSPGTEGDLKSVLNTLPRDLPVVLIRGTDASPADPVQLGEAYVWLSSEQRPLHQVISDAAARARRLDLERHVCLSIEEIDRMRAAVSRVSHDIKNPLAIISGNAQLLAELTKAFGVEEDMMQPIQDIEEASQRITVLLQRIQELGSMLPPSR